MATEDDGIELAVEAKPEAKSSMGKMILFMMIGVFIAAGGTLGTLFAMGILPPGANAAVVEGTDAAAEAEPEEIRDAVYVSLDPPFTVNFRDRTGARYLQVTLEAMTREEDVEGLLKQHMPVIRNDLMLILSSKSSAELGTREGKEALQEEALGAVQKILEREAEKPGVEAIYFTSFVMQ